jgi:geranylgeranyl pyrophosphate synthase
MNEELKNANASYRLAEQEAAHYFESLSVQLLQKTYIAPLINDIQSWKKNHVHPNPFVFLFSLGKGKSYSKGYHNYIQWLDYTGKLDNYLDRSISYIYMRDLGKALDSPDTQSRIRNTVDSIKSYLTDTNSTGRVEPFSIAELYRLAQKDSVESTLIWVMDKLKTVSANIPKGMDAEEAKRKLIKIIAGVILHAVEEMDAEITPKERARKLDEAIRLGYSYGLTYPFIDDLLDANVLSNQEKKRYSELIRTALITESVPNLDEWTGKNADLIRFIHSELREAFEYIKGHQRPETRKLFFEQSYVFFNSQEVDRVKDLSNANYTNEALYIPIILKSSFSRLITRSVISAPEDEGFATRTFIYGIYNQLADDFADMFDDLKEGRVTPYTYYLTYHDKRSDLINPFEMYWTVIFNLIHNVYRKDNKTCEVILNRAINGLKRFKERMGIKKYNEVMGLFASGNPAFNKVIQNMVRKADDVDFFDKLLRDHMIGILKSNRKEREDFLETIETVRNQINDFLTIPEIENGLLTREPIIDAANYSLDSDGKRLRPIITWVMGVNEYGLNKSSIAPLLRSLEYMHTASLIFDDLPSQDNASTRRGRPTLHQEYDVAIAELTALFLTQKAVEEQTSLDQFDSKTVLNLIHYSSRIVGDMCRGQAMDLNSRGNQLTLEELNRMCFYKTGIAFEASLIMPAILAQADELEMDALKRFARHAGIAFQIKDDLLDVEGDLYVLGKPIGIDADNNNATFVSILGVADARKAMWGHYCDAMETLLEIPRNTAFLKHLLYYIVNRDR